MGTFGRHLALINDRDHLIVDDEDQNLEGGDTSDGRRPNPNSDVSRDDKPEIDS